MKIVDYFASTNQEYWLGEIKNRSWRSREGIRYDLVILCKKLVEII